MIVRPMRSFVAAIVGLLAAIVLIVLGLWVALIDTFFAMRGLPQTGVATALGIAAVSTGAIAIAVGRKAAARDRFAIGCLTGSALVTSAVAAAVGVWLIAIPALIVLAIALVLNGHPAPAERRHASRAPSKKGPRTGTVPTGTSHA
jgi:hypothetical protein